MNAITTRFNYLEFLLPLSKKLLSLSNQTLYFCFQIFKEPFRSNLPINR